MQGHSAIAGIKVDPHADQPIAMLDGALATLLILAVILLYTVSGGMLWFVGYNYEGLTGSAVTKIHPGSYLVFLIVLCMAFRGGNPLAPFVDMARQRPACLLLLVAAIAMFLNIVLRNGPGMAGTLDCYLLPPFVVMLFAKTNEATRSRIEWVIHLSMLANAGLGLFELATHQLFFPFRLDGTVYAQDTRSSALQGHPLGNATITAFYVMALLSGGGRLSAFQRLAMIVLQIMALVAFGGRVALVTTILFTGLYGLVLCYRTLRARKIPILGMAVASVGLTLVPIIIIGLYVGGFFDAILSRFEQDGGSANARVEMLHLLSEIPLQDLIVGPDAGLVDSLRRVDGLELGIENPIVRTLVYQGAVMTGFLMIAVGFFLYELARWSRRGMMLPMLGFLIIINTFESLAGKSTLLAKFALMMLVLYRPLRLSVQRGGSFNPRASITSASSTRVASSISPMESKRFQNAHGKPRASAASRTSRM